MRFEEWFDAALELGPDLPSGHGRGLRRTADRRCAAGTARARAQGDRRPLDPHPREPHARRWPGAADHRRHRAAPAPGAAVAAGDGRRSGGRRRSRSPTPAAAAPMSTRPLPGSPDSSPAEVIGPAASGRAASAAGTTPSSSTPSTAAWAGRHLAGADRQSSQGRRADLTRTRPSRRCGTLDGRITHFVAVKRDVTEQEKAEAAIRASEARYRAVVDTQTEFIARIAPDGRLSFVNDAYCRYYGQPGRSCSAAASTSSPGTVPEDRERDAAHLASAHALQARRGPSSSGGSCPMAEYVGSQWADTALFDGRRAAYRDAIGRPGHHRTEKQRARFARERGPLPCAGGDADRVRAATAARRSADLRQRGLLPVRRVRRARRCSRSAGTISRWSRPRIARPTRSICGR